MLVPGSLRAELWVPKAGAEKGDNMFGDLFGAVVRTTVNLVKLPISLPLAVAKDAIEEMGGDDSGAAETRKVIQELKDDASPS